MLVIYTLQCSLLAIVLAGLPLAASTLIKALYKHCNSKVSSKTQVQNVLYTPLLWVRRRMNAWLFLVKGPSIIQAGYDRAKGAAYEVFTPESRYVFVSSEQHIKELDALSDSTASLQAAAKQLLQPRYTMSNFNWLDKRGVDGTPLIKTLRTLLTNNIPQILPSIRIAVSSKIDAVVENLATAHGVKHLPLYSTILSCVSYSNALAFFGEDLARDAEFMKAAVQFIESTLLVAEILRLLPAWMHPTIGKWLGSFSKSHQVLHSRLMPITEQRIEDRIRKAQGHSVTSHKDCIQWVMESSPRSKPWTAERIVHELMALWFGSVHIVTTNLCFAIHDLCLHPEYVPALRSELDSAWKHFEQTGKGLPLLDSFLKESARTTPTESMSSRRMALQPFTLSDGTHLKAGDWLCTPLRAMSRDERLYKRAAEFHGFRHVEPEVLEQLERGFEHFGKPSPLTETKNSQLWGTGRMACPGRFYATAVMKTIMAALVSKYDMELSSPKSRRHLVWRSFVYPLPTTKVAVKLRATVEVS